MNRRGLTLIEVLAATVILSSSAAVCAGLLRSARQALESPRASIQELAALADAFMEDPELFGIEKSDLASMGSMSINWPESLGGLDSVQAGELALTPVLVTLIEATEAPENTLPHGWMTFKYEGQAVVRYLTLPEDEG